MRESRQGIRREDDERFRRISAIASDISYSCRSGPDGDFSIDWMAGAVERILGCSIDEVIEKRCWGSCVMKEDRPLFDEKVIGLQPGERGFCELRLRRRDGCIVWVSSSAECVPGESGSPCRILYGCLADITGRKNAEETLRESEARYQVLFEHSPIPIWEEDFSGLKTWLESLDPADLRDLRGYFGAHPDRVVHCATLVKIVKMNRTSLRFFGIDDQDRIHESLPEYFTEESLAVFEAEVIALAGGSTVFESEIPVRSPSGSLLTLLLSLSVVPGSERNLDRVLVSFMDITGRKNAERKLQAALRENGNLLSELQHRVKNSLVMIHSMISLALDNASHPSARAALEELCSRVASIAELYSILYSGGSFQELRLDDYCARVAGPLIGLHPDIAFAPDLEPLTVSAKEAAPIGLILTELITNAVKYAFPEGTRGTIEVSLKKMGAKIRLEVMDDGTGLPGGCAIADQAGIGLDLVRGLSEQIGGSFSMAGRERGTRCVVEFAPGQGHDA